MRVALIVNPATRDAGRAIRATLAASAHHGWAPPLLLTTTVDQPGGEQAAKAIAEGVDRIVVAGGDGTLRHVAGALASRSSTVPIGIMPVGAGNIVALNLGLRSRGLDAAAEAAITGGIHPLSVGWVECRRGGEWAPETPMLAVAGIGRDAQAIAATRPWLKRRTGWLAYAEAGARHALRPSVPMTVSLDEGEATAVHAWSVLVANLPRLPMGAVAFPGTAPGGRTMRVLQVRLRHPAQWGAVAVKGLTRLPVAAPALYYDDAGRVLVEPSRALPVEIDGDLVTGVEAMRVRLQPRAVNVVVRHG